MRDLLATYDAWRAEGLDVGRAVVIRTFGSSPWLEGASLLVASDGRMIGTVSGGCVEAAAASEVLRAQEAGRSRVIRYGIADDEAWGVGLACGGTIDVLIEPAVSDAAIEAARTAASDGSAGLGAVVVTPLPNDEDSAPLEATPVGTETLAAESAAALAAGRSGVVESEGLRYFVEVRPARPRLVVVGASEVARRLVALAAELGHTTAVVDPRSAFATHERFPEADHVVIDWPEEAFETLQVGPADAVAILSHDPKLDEPSIVEAIRRRVRYVGAIGSRRTQDERRRRLIEGGLDPEALARLHGPIGLDLGGREPAETALAILAEIVATRRGGSAAADRGAPAGSTTRA